MTLPFINLNGSSPARLTEGYKIAAIAVEAALGRIVETAPNGRDYLDGYALREATKEHARRLGALRDIIAELEALAAHCEVRR